ncbi:hypothetical protein ABIF63_004891 [Bradyrhizobium japonicum]|uniref:Uncharacterized protein n=1 Tax=Bradyrhizobium japonicum TaxID=375 RepID=A0ABV2RV15_BRAJP
MIIVAGALDHLLKFGTIVIGRGCALFDEPRNQLPTLAVAKGIDRESGSEW